MTKPKGKTPSLLSCSTGKPVPYVCKRKSNCKRCDAEVHNGDICAQIPKSSGGFMVEKIHCLNCLEEMIKQTKIEISAIENSFTEFHK